MDRVKQIEQSIIKKYRKPIWRKFVKAIQTYDLIQPGDNIAVCISGGKDSMLMAKLLQEIKRHGQFDFGLVFLSMDPGYNQKNRQKIEENAKIMGIPVQFFESDIFQVVTNIEKSPCYLCARMRRGFLYAKAKELGCNKIALGHHMDDILETLLMNITFQGAFSTMPPKLVMRKFEMTIIRPMCLVHEADLIEMARIRGFRKQIKDCPYESLSNRSNMKEVLYSLEKMNPEARYSLWKCMTNIQEELLPGMNEHDL